MFELYEEAGPGFVKTSTELIVERAIVKDVWLIHKVVQAGMRVKFSARIRA